MKRASVWHQIVRDVLQMVADNSHSLSRKTEIEKSKIYLLNTSPLNKMVLIKETKNEIPEIYLSNTTPLSVSVLIKETKNQIS